MGLTLLMMMLIFSTGLSAFKAVAAWLPYKSDMRGARDAWRRWRRSKRYFS